MAEGLRWGVMGAGAIGCYVGGRLAARGADVVLVGRASVAAEVAAHGLRLSDYRGWQAAPTVTVVTDPVALADRDVVLVTVKGADTEEAARALAPALAREALVVSLQNGVRNADLLARALPAHAVVQGMVPFNVARPAPGHFHQGTSGALALADTPRARVVVAALVAAGLPTKRHADMRGVAWGKLVVNLNNAVNALAGVPIQAMLRQRAYRRVMAEVVREGLVALAAARVRPRLPVPLPPRLLPGLLAAPDLVFRTVARSMLRVDPQARSSMWDDLVRGRRTEVDLLNGEVVRLAAEVGTRAPVNAAIVDLVHEAHGRGSPGLSAEALTRRLGLA